MSFANWLQKELDKRGWSQAELARRSGVAQGQISKILTRNRNAGAEVCIAIAEAIQVSREEIFRARGWLLSESERDVRLQLSPKVTKMASQVEHLPPTQRRTALHVMDALLEALEQEVSAQ